MRGVRGVVGDHLTARGYACGLACALFLSVLLALSAQARGGETTLPYDIAADLDRTSRSIGPLAFAPAAPTQAGREARWRAETAMISAVAKWMSRAPDRHPEIVSYAASKAPAFRPEIFSYATKNFPGSATAIHRAEGLAPPRPEPAPARQAPVQQAKSTALPPSVAEAGKPQLVSAGAALAAAQEARASEKTEDPPLLRFHNPFRPCRGDCSVTLFGGKFVDTALTDILFKPTAPWDWKMGDIYFVSGAFTRPVATLGDYLSVDVDTGVGKRFKGANEVETWVALYLRWLPFPWDRYLDTSFGLSTGLNYASGTPRREEKRAGGEISPMQHYFSPEVVFTLPDFPDYSLAIRLHHRSNAYIFEGDGGFQYLLVGLRANF